MIQAFVLAVTVFIGWTLLDFVKKKRLTKESLIGSFITAILAGVVWFIMELIISFL
ncbi:hypothetical protein ACJ2A9_14690 [Anaerobacillus sp. MEB173]|uniref:hypothetical protein n=1 Tax=Anaerobacillus sp. MEB173 TaxID=3383345 RepID=UPI003F8DAAC7